MRTIAVGATLACAALIGIACQGNSSTGPSSDETTVSGTYRLTSVRGLSLPVPLFGQCSLGDPSPCSDCSFSAVSGTLTLETGAKQNPFSLNLVASGPCVDPLGRSPTGINSTSSGTSANWTTSGNTITFSGGESNPMGISTATVSGSTVSMSFNWLNPTRSGQNAAVTAVFSK